MELQGSNARCIEELPDEILAQILSYLSYEEAMAKSCQLVCRRWNDIIVDLWRMRSIRMYPEIQDLKDYKPITKMLWRKVATNNPFDKNLLKNHTGEKGNFEHWLITHNGGDRWKLEKPPVGVFNVDGDNSDLNIESSFVSSYGVCVKSQMIDLLKEGFSAQILDTLQPEITVSEYYARRIDCSAEYALHVELLTADKNRVDDIKFKHLLNTENSHGWQKVTHTFRNYGPNVRFINFVHKGKDLKFWAGHYGSKMAKANVQISLRSIFVPTTPTPSTS